MSKPQDRMVHKAPDGWANSRNGASRAEGIYPTQKEAIEAARQNLRNSGGGELTIQGRDGRIREKDTVPPGNDPCPPKDKQ
ncbi:MAG: hypothetical protein A2Y38_05945 [Spirochaetes bacterium GWB1_59_5]|nr:MAG: hypothetical protein A2Y38_05945 [Spirochaetes bacterium GWB1_59_5]